ncbi:MAG: class I SAM-dependent methyltransferase [Pseudomonadota bacterium]
MNNGWDSSAAAWVADMGDQGDFPRAYVLDDPMIARVRASGAETALDLGCGEGRFSRIMQCHGLKVTGVDPTPALLDVAAARDTKSAYVRGRAEAVPMISGSVDLVVSYLSLIDMEDLETVYDEVIRVLRPGGRFLIANLSSFATAVPEGDLTGGWLRGDRNANQPFGCDNYNQERSYWIGWRGIRVRNFHRPMQGYMAPLLQRGLTLTHFEEPVPSEGPPDKVATFRRAPMFVVMEWQKPG